jgi:quinol monooxygenase YgiN
LHLVINRLPLSGPLTDELLEKIQREFIPGAQAEPGFVSYRLGRVSDAEYVVVAEYQDMDSLQRISSGYAAPWFEENVKPLLAGPPERIVAEVIAST